MLQSGGNLSVSIVELRPLSVLESLPAHVYCACLSQEDRALGAHLHWECGYQSLFLTPLYTRLVGGVRRQESNH